MFIKKAVLIGAAKYVSLFGVSLGATVFFLNGNKKSSDSDGGNSFTPVVEELTAGPKLINSILSYNALDLDGDISLILEDNTRINLGINGQGKISDLTNIEILADLDADIDGTHVIGEVGYFGDTLTFSADDLCYFKLQTDDILSFVDMIPTDGIEISLPESLTNFSIDDILVKINALKDEDKVFRNDKYYFEFNFGEGDEQFTLYVVTDEDDNFLGLTTDRIDFNGTLIQLDFDVKELSDEEYTATNPLNGENKDKYQDFKPVFTMINDIFTLTDKKQLGFDVAVTVDKANEDNSGYRDFLVATAGIDLDIENKKYGFDINIDEDGRSHDLFFGFENKTIYADYRGLDIAIDTSTIGVLLEVILQNLDITSLLSSVNLDLGNLDIGDISNKIKGLLGPINVYDGEFNVTLDLNSFGLDVDPILIILKFDENNLLSLSISKIAISNIQLGLEINFRDYSDFTIEKDKYTDMKSAVILTSSIFELIDDNNYSLGFEGEISNSKKDKLPVKMNGDVQFNIKDKFGYGNLTIIDSNEDTHKVVADMTDGKDFLFTYNETLKGKFDSDTLSELLDLLIHVIAEPDQHFIELFGEIIEFIQNTPIFKAIFADELGLLFDYDIISNLVFTETTLEFDLSLEVIGFDSSMHLTINFEIDEEKDVGKLTSVELSGFEIEGINIEFKVNLQEYDTSKDNTRLDPNGGKYLDFSDIKTLLEFGINTSKYNYYKFECTASVSIGGILTGAKLLDITLPMVVEIRNESGKVKVKASISNIPTIVGVNKNTKYLGTEDRKATVYYNDGYIYVERTEKVLAGLGSIFTGKKNYVLRAKYTEEYFLTNIVNILLQDILGLNDTIMEKVSNSDTSGLTEGKKIAYEKILSDFSYSKSKGQFNIGIALSEIINLDLIPLINVIVDTNQETKELTGLTISANINLGIKIKLNLPLVLTDTCSEVFDYDESGNIKCEHEGSVIEGFNKYIDDHKNDTENVVKAGIVK